MNFFQQAYSGENKWWQYLLAILFILIGWQLIGIIPLVSVATMFSEDMVAFQKAGDQNFMGLGIPANLYFFLMIFMFGMGLLFLFIAVKRIHKRKILTVLTSREKFDWQRFFFAVFVWTVASVAMILIDYSTHPQDFIWNFKWQPFLILVLLSLLFLPLQTSFEEVLFRGYFLQGLGVLFKNKWMPLLVTSLAFGLLHGFNPEVAKLGKILLLYYIITGLFFGVLTLLDEGLELALGLHAANNAVSAIFVTTNWTVFQTDALLIDKSEPNLGMMMYIPLLVVYPLVFVILLKKYGWKNFSDKLWGKVERVE